MSRRLGAGGPGLNSRKASRWRMGNTENAVDVADTVAEALKKTLPFAGSAAKTLGPVSVTLAVAKAGRDDYNFVR